MQSCSRAELRGHPCMSQLGLQAVQMLGGYHLRQNAVFESEQVILHRLEAVILVQRDCRAKGGEQFY